MVGVKKRVMLSNDLPTNPITSTARQVFEGRKNQVLLFHSGHAQVFFGNQGSEGGARGQSRFRMEFLTVKCDSSPYPTCASSY